MWLVVHIRWLRPPAGFLLFLFIEPRTLPGGIVLPTFRGDHPP